MKNLSGDFVETSYFDDKGHYRKKEQAEFDNDFNRILDLWNSFLIMQKAEGLELGKDYFIHKRNLFEVVKRLDKRRSYYYVFHKIDRICEYKEVAIICYWINTLKPFMVVNEKSNIYNSPNEMFSLYIILSTIAGIFEQMYPNEEFKTLDSRTVQDYVYNFKYCDMSREAMIFFVETLAKSYGVGMENNPGKTNPSFSDSRTN